MELLNVEGSTFCEGSVCVPSPSLCVSLSDGVEEDEEEDDDDATNLFCFLSFRGIIGCGSVNHCAGRGCVLAVAGFTSNNTSTTYAHESVNDSPIFVSGGSLNPNFSSSACRRFSFSRRMTAMEGEIVFFMKDTTTPHPHARKR